MAGLIKIKKRIFFKLLKEYCSVNSIDIKEHSSGWVIELRKGDKKRIIYGYDLPLNNSSSSKTANDKCATYEMLKSNKIPAVEHKIFLKQKHSNTIDDNKDINITGKVVVKPNNGSGGDMVELASNNEEARQLIKDIHDSDRSVAVSPFYNIKKEYRVIILDNKTILTYSKIPEKGKWKHNLSDGASVKIEENSLNNLVSKAADTLNLRLCSVDIIETDNNEFLVLEINPSICLERFATGEKEKKAKEVYFRIFDELFK